MSCLRVISNISPLALVLGITLGMVTPALAEMKQWTEAAGVLYEGDGKGHVPSPNPQQGPNSTITSLTVPSEQKINSGSPMPAERGVSDFAMKLAFDLGLIRHREEDARSVLDHVGITPLGGWTASSECTREVFYDVLAAARRAAIAGRLSVSADGAEAIVRAAFTLCLSTRQEVTSEQTPFVTAEDRPSVVSEGPMMLYEQEPTWPLEWLGPSFAGPVVIIAHPPLRPRVFRHFPVFVRCPPWQYRPSFAFGGFPAVRRHVVLGPRVAPPVRVVRAPPQFFAPPRSRFSVVSGFSQRNMGHIQGGFSRR